jgi:hypothetical protein
MVMTGQVNSVVTRVTRVQQKSTSNACVSGNRGYGFFVFLSPSDCTPEFL